MLPEDQQFADYLVSLFPKYNIGACTRQYLREAPADAHLEYEGCAIGVWLLDVLPHHSPELAIERFAESDSDVVRFLCLETHRSIPFIDGVWIGYDGYAFVRKGANYTEAEMEQHQRGFEVGRYVRDKTLPEV